MKTYELTRLLAAYDVLEGLVEGSRAEALAAIRCRTLAGAAAELPAAYLEAASVPDRLGFG